MRLDWEGAYARLRAAQERLDAIDQNVGNFEALLQARAAALASAPGTVAAAGITDYVVFSAGGVRYAVEATAIDEVVEVTAPALLPGAPAMYRGLLAHRGIVFPLIDVGPLIGAAPAAEPFGRALLFVSDRQTAAIGAEAIETLRGVDLAAFAPAKGDGRAAVSGTTADGVTLLDVWILLGDARLIVDD